MTAGVLLDLASLTRFGVDALVGRCDGLVSAAARRRLLRARVDAGDVFSYGAFEVRLDDDDDRVDVLGCVTRDDGGFDALPTTSPPELARAIAHWRRAPQAIEALWVEVDVVGAQAVPFAFFRFAAGVATADVVAAAQALSTSKSSLVALAAFASSLSPQEQLLHVAHVGGRAGAAVDDVVRVHVGVAPDRVGAVVAGVVDEDVADAAVDVAGAWPAGGLLGLQLNLAADRRSPFVDLELFLPSSPVDDPRWRAPLARMCRSASIDAARLTLLERWPTRRGEPPSSSWPLELQRTLQVKLRLTRGGATAKGYLGFSPRLVVG